MYQTNLIENNTTQTIEEQCQKAFESKQVLSSLDTELKNKVLNLFKKNLLTDSMDILAANQKDIENGLKNKLTSALIDRLTLTKERLKNIADSIDDIIQLDDPIGIVLDEWIRPNGLSITKIRVPLGVIGIIYEARPNVTADAIAIAIKTGNAIVLRGSASAYNTNFSIVSILHKTLKSLNLDRDIVQLLEDTSRESVKSFVKMNKYLSLIIPRGGANLIQNVVNSATVPTIETGVGNCHLYIDEFADLDKALNIADNSKTNRPSVCNACETILINEKIAAEFLPKLEKRFQKNNVTIKGCSKTKKFVDRCDKAEEIDWHTEYLDMIVAIKIVKDVNEACSHIKTYGTLHTEAIVTENEEHMTLFSTLVDASTVIINASTRFTDGGEFGFGAEIGISTQKLHARGPMGLSELTSYKYIVHGEGQVR
tara:strand:+ start:1595 stop:2872 length:1278 start_codon:yes stop_codon:yes gene_type:complete